MKNILITGCGSGLGNALLKKGLSFDCNLYPNVRKDPSATWNEDNFLVGDINDPTFRNEFSGFLNRKRIDVFINNAAIYKNGPFIDLDDATIVDVLNTNLVSQILMIKSVYKFFKENGYGLIINVNSLSGLHPSLNETIYCAAKSGLRGFSKCLQLESVNTRIEIIDLFPGAMKTRMTADRKGYEGFINPDDVADMIYNTIFCDKSYYINELVIRKRK